jgi:hypothetical protein
VSTYLEEFEAALQRGRDLGLTVPAVDLDVSRRWLSESGLVKLGPALGVGLGTDPRGLVGQCLPVHLNLAPLVSEALSCDAMFTIGWLHADGRDRFRFDHDFVATALKHGIAPGQASLHAWLTLPSMEIIDATYPTSVGVLSGMPDLVGLVVTKHADELTGDMAYHPMLVGDDFLHRSGALRTGILLS